MSVLSSIYIQHLPTFVPDQHALQRSTSCDLTQPQFPVHLLLWVGWQKASVSTKTQFLFIHCDSKLFLKKHPTVSQTMETEEHITLAKKWLRSSGQFSKSSPSLWSTKIVHTAIGERERDTKASPAKLFTDVVFDLSHPDFCYYRSEYQPPAEIYPLALMWPKGVKISRVHLENTDTHDWCLEPEPTLKDGKKWQRERESERKKDMWLGAMHIQRFGGRAGYMAVRKDVSICACMCAWGVCESCGQQQMAGLVPLGGRGPIDPHFSSDACA